jgi:hypothetical protein
MCAMSSIENRIAELEEKAANYEMMGALAADPELRAESRRRAEELLEKARALREEFYKQSAA